MDVETVLTETKLLEVGDDRLMEDDRREEKTVDDDNEDGERIGIIFCTYQKPFWWHSIRITVGGFGVDE